jgi:hypothetical protein
MVRPLHVVVSAPDQFPTPLSKLLDSTVVSNRRLQEEGLGLGLGDRGDGVGLTEGDTVRLAVAVVDGVTDGVAEAVCDPDSEIELVAELLSEGDTVDVALAVNEAVAVDDWDVDCVELSDAVEVGLADADTDGVCDGVCDGDPLEDSLTEDDPVLDDDNDVEPLVVGVMDGVVDVVGELETQAPKPVCTDTSSMPRPAMKIDVAMLHCTVSTRVLPEWYKSIMMVRLVSEPHPAGLFFGLSGAPQSGVDGKVVYPVVNLLNVPMAAPSTSTLNVSLVAQPSMAIAVRDTRTMECVGRSVTRTSAV